MTKEKINVLVTGSNGQLGQCLYDIRNNKKHIQWTFTNSKTLDIANKPTIEKSFENKKFDYVVNCAAYTNVEQAEKEPEKAYKINAEGVKNLAEVCKEFNAILIHISTDYVFDGIKQTSYTEEDVPNPINEYGKSKLAGERYVQEILDRYFIIRTSWLYSQYGKNFYTTVVKKIEAGEDLKITTSETGSPTNANDLATFIVEVILSNSNRYGIYHFSNKGEATWHDFAYEIVKQTGNFNQIRVEKVENYPTLAKRPGYSVLDITKCSCIFNIRVSYWQEVI